MRTVPLGTEATAVSVGKAVLRIRQEKRMTQSEVGRGARLATSYISRIENNHIQPTMATLGRLADALGVSVSSIFQVGEKGGVPVKYRCPVSAAGDCIGEQIRSHRGRPPRGGRAAYGKEELRLLRMTDFLARHGPRPVRQALAVVLESLMNRASRQPPRARRRHPE
ncbi:MAG: helix-turn-helix domain-containing protein [Planctomycetota bacterium]